MNDFDVHVLLAGAPDAEEPLPSAMRLARAAFPAVCSVVGASAKVTLVSLEHADFRVACMLAASLVQAGVRDVCVIHIQDPTRPWPARPEKPNYECHLACADSAPHERCCAIAHALIVLAPAVPARAVPLWNAYVKALRAERGHVMREPLLIDERR